jgi:transposase
VSRQTQSAGRRRPFILVIIWHLLADPTSLYHDLGADYHNDRLSIQRRTRSYVQQLRALGYEVTLTAAS